MAFRTAELAYQVEPVNGVDGGGGGKGFVVMLRCGFQSLDDDNCSGTHIDVLMQGKGLNDPSNLQRLRDALQEVMRTLDQLPPPGAGPTAGE